MQTVLDDLRFVGVDSRAVILIGTVIERPVKWSRYAELANQAVVACELYRQSRRRQIAYCWSMMIEPKMRKGLRGWLSL